MKYIYLFIFLAFIQNVYSQNENEVNSKKSFLSLSANAGIALSDNDYGQALNLDATYAIDKQGNTLGFNFTYARIEQQNDNSYYYLLKYSVLAGHEFSKVKTFSFQVKYGISLLRLNSYTTDKPIFGIDGGIEMSYNVLGPLHLNLGLISSLNKETSIFIHSFTGIKLLL